MIRGKSMSNESSNLKQDFKEFISTLATGICKEVLLEEMKDLCDGFKRIEEKYNYLYLNSRDNTNKFIKQVNKLEDSTANIEKFSDNIRQQNSNVSEALRIIKSDNEKVVENILNKNNKLLTECTNKIQTLNTYEREKFLRELDERLKKHTDYYFDRLDDLLHSDVIKDLRSSLDTIVINQEKNKKDLQSRLDSTTLRVERGINSNVSALENKVKELSELTLDLNQKMKIRTNILLSLNAILLVIFIILFAVIIAK